MGKQRNGWRRRLGRKDGEMKKEVKLEEESATTAEVDDDAKNMDCDDEERTEKIQAPVASSSRIPLRDAFLKRSAAVKMNCFRDAFEQLRIQRQKSGAAVDHEDLLRILDKSSATRRSALTDKL